MIFEKMCQAKNTEDIFKEIACGIIDYKRKMLNSLSGGSIPDTELPFILAALKLLAEDIETVISRKAPEEKEKMYGCCEDVCEFCRYATSTISVNVKGEG